MHIGVTQPEDILYRTPGTRYSYVSADYLASDANFAVPIDNPPGPWDFTQLELADIGNHRAILAPTHPEVSSFAGDFSQSYDHFMKTEGIYNFVEGAVYVAERFDSTPDKLVWVGLQEGVSQKTILR